VSRDIQKVHKQIRKMFDEAYSILEIDGAVEPTHTKLVGAMEALTSLRLWVEDEFLLEAD